jgi:Ca2+:H+ antiporter
VSGSTQPANPYGQLKIVSFVSFGLGADLLQAFHASFSSVDNADAAVLKVSRGTSVILLLTYVLYLLFQLKSHAYMYASTPQHKIDEESAPGILRRMHSSSSSSAASTISSVSQGTGGSKRRISRKLKSKLGKKRRAKIEDGPDTVADAPGRTAISNESGEKSLQIVESPSALEPQEAMTMNSAPRPARPGKPMPRGLSFRPPPVFRAPTDPTANASPKRNLRPSQSLPIVRDTGLPSKMSGKVRTGSIAEESSEPPMSRTASVLLLLASTALVALCAEFLVDSIDYLVETSPISEAFIGLIILPMVGNAAEHVTAVTVAAKNKMDLAIGVAIGSSIQIALFITPVVVILGWILDKEMSLFFTLFETVTLFVSTFVVNFLVLDGRSNYLEGVLLTASYIIIAVSAFFFPDGEDQNRLVTPS